MHHRFGKTIVLGLGGSVIVPNDVDTKLLAAWKELIDRHSKKHRFVIVVGGGKLARRYQEAAAAVHSISAREKDLIGIEATRLNAKLVQSVFGSRADAELIDSETKAKPLTKPVTVGCGWEKQTGRSTDYAAAVLADIYGAAAVIMAGKPAFVYDRNPDQFVTAKPFTELSWKQYAKIAPKKWTPGANVPIDPVCAKFCRTHGIAAIVADGRNLRNMERLLAGEECDGTLVS